MGAIYETALWLVLCQVILCATVSPSAKTGWQWGIAIGACISAGYGILQVLGWDPVGFEPPYQAHAFFGNPNTTAQTLLLALCVMPKTNMARAMRVLILLGILACGSRAVWLATVAWALFFTRDWWRADKARTYAAWVAAALSIIVILGSFAIKVEPPREGLVERKIPGLKHGSLRARQTLYLNSIAMLSAKPLQGLGSGQFQIWYPRYAKAVIDDVNLNADYRPRQVHNVFLLLGLQFGLPWLLLGALIIWLGRTRWIWISADTNLALLLQIAVAMVSLNYLNPVVVISLAILVKPEEPNQTQRQSSWGSHLIFLVALAVLATADWQAARAKRMSPPVSLQSLFPGEIARQAFTTGDHSAALHWQMRQLAEDPWAPDTLHNAALIALANAKHSEDEFAQFGRATLAVTTHHFPHFKPAVEWSRRWPYQGDSPPNSNGKPFPGELVDDSQALRTWLRSLTKKSVAQLP